MGVGLKLFIKIVGVLGLLLLLAGAGGIGFLYLKHGPEPYQPTYTIALPTLNGVPGVIMKIGERDGFQTLDRIVGRFQGVRNLELVPVEGLWALNESDLLPFEAALGDYVDEHKPTDGPNTPLGLGWLSQFGCTYDLGDQKDDLLANSLRQYIGFTSDGRQYLYVNGVGREPFEFFFGSGANTPSLDDLAYRDYSGFDYGPTTFYALYDVERAEIIWFRYEVFYQGVC